MEGSKLPLTKVLLNIIHATGEIAVDFYYIAHDAKYHRVAFARGGHDLVVELKRLNKLKNKKRKLSRTLYQLKKSKYIDVNKVGDRLMVNLTDKGRISILLSRLNNVSLCKKHYVVVIFDIPETKNVIRRHFRQILKSAGFIKLQQSVWISKKDVYKILNEFVEYLGIKSWVKIFYALNLSDKI